MILSACSKKNPGKEDFNALIYLSECAYSTAKTPEDAIVIAEISIDWLNAHAKGKDRNIRLESLSNLCDYYIRLALLQYKIGDYERMTTALANFKQAKKTIIQQLVEEGNVLSDQLTMESDEKADKVTRDYLISIIRLDRYVKKIPFCSGWNYDDADRMIARRAKRP